MLVVGLVTACGTRLPDRDFVTVAAGPAGPTATATAVAPGVADPSSTISAGPLDPGATTAANGPAGRPTAGASAAANTASDVGVTTTTIRLGTISSRTNAFDPTAFVGPTYGIQAFVDDLNRHGGVHGRTVQLFSCDDHGDGSRNNACVHQLIDTDKVFALVSNAIFSYAGASYVQSKGVPDIGSQPIDTAYSAFSHLWDIYGESYPRNGTVGYRGQLEGGTEVYRFFNERFPKVARKAGIVYYNQADSQRYADNLAKGLEKEGYSVVQEEVNFALPNYDAAVLDMKSQGVTYVYDALDAGGNQNLCAALDSNDLSRRLTAKVTTTQSWVASIATQYQQSPVCRSKIWSTGNSLSYEDTQYAGVRAFREAMARRHTDGPDQLSE
ncbi:MAG: amino acid/amide transporter substrate-binding protein family, partial [Frankiales bacterium]|nr:amino acid/amide transporter substrate-binding protein family [Frankiales bacterium]